MLKGSGCATRTEETRGRHRSTRGSAVREMLLIILRQRWRRHDAVKAGMRYPVEGSSMRRRVHVDDDARGQCVVRPSCWTGPHSIAIAPQSRGGKSSRAIQFGGRRNVVDGRNKLVQMTMASLKPKEVE